MVQKPPEIKKSPPKDTPLAAKKIQKNIKLSFPIRTIPSVSESHRFRISFSLARGGSLKIDCRRLSLPVRNFASPQRQAYYSMFSGACQGQTAGAENFLKTGFVFPLPAGIFYPSMIRQACPSQKIRRAATRPKRPAQFRLSRYAGESYIV